LNIDTIQSTNKKNAINAFFSIKQTETIRRLQIAEGVLLCHIGQNSTMPQVTKVSISVFATFWHHCQKANWLQLLFAYYDAKRKWPLKTNILS
jgi:hypothetical protein